jgi:hypothetical protein
MIALRDLDEVPTWELETEIARRHQCRKEHRCGH